MICDNYGTHKHPTVRKWLEAHPRFHMHFTPNYSSWINHVERFFASIPLTCWSAATTVPCRHSRGHPRLDESLDDNPRPFIWTKTAEEILT